MLDDYIEVTSKISFDFFFRGRRCVYKKCRSEVFDYKIDLRVALYFYCFYCDLYILEQILKWNCSKKIGFMSLIFVAAVILCLVYCNVKLVYAVVLIVIHIITWFIQFIDIWYHFRTNSEVVFTVWRNFCQLITIE